MHVFLKPGVRLMAGVTGALVCAYVIYAYYDRLSAAGFYLLVLGCVVVSGYLIGSGKVLLKLQRLVKAQYPDQATYMATHRNIIHALKARGVEPSNAVELSDDPGKNRLRLLSPQKDHYTVVHTSYESGEDAAGTLRTVVTDTFYHLDEARWGVQTSLQVYFGEDGPPRSKEFSKRDARKRIALPEGANLATLDELHSLEHWIATWK